MTFNALAAELRGEGDPLRVVRSIGRTLRKMIDDGVEIGAAVRAIHTATASKKNSLIDLGELGAR
jgi:hypothetical protein